MEKSRHLPGAGCAAIRLLQRRSARHSSGVPECRLTQVADMEHGAAPDLRGIDSTHYPPFNDQQSGLASDFQTLAVPTP